MNRPWDTISTLRSLRILGAVGLGISAGGSSAYASCGDYIEPTADLDGDLRAPPVWARSLVLGTHCVPAAYSVEVAGPVPEVDEEVAEWAEGAVERIVAMYTEEGFPAARAWWTRTLGKVTFGVDEGRITRVAFEGANAIEKLTLADNIVLMDGVLYAPSVQASLDDLVTTNGLTHAIYRFIEGDDYTVNALGKLVPEQVMVVSLIGEESSGWGFGVGVESPWGPTVSTRYRSKAVLGAKDHASTYLNIAFPLQEYAFETEPQFRWIYGGFGLDYRFASWRGGIVSPLVTLRSSLGVYQRDDLRIRNVNVNQNGIQLAAQIRVSKVYRQTIGLRGENANLIDIDMYQPRINTLDEPRGAGRLALVSNTEFQFDDGTLRTDLRDYISLSNVLATNSDFAFLLRTRLRGQWVISVGQDDLLLRARGLYYQGDVRFYHQEQLGGKYQKVFFGHQYWVEKAGQLEVAYRLRLRRNLKLGVWHDLSVFVDETQEDTPVALANGAGLGVHLLLLDQFALDLLYGGGFAPTGFSHNMVINFQMVY